MNSPKNRQVKPPAKPRKSTVKQKKSLMQKGVSANARKSIVVINQGRVIKKNQRIASLEIKIRP
ncbi:hypothetical protein S70_09155 [Providencia stuartii MRSN 2154]|uniref:Uncharacterized protein n=1 Tax=Providencia stuartii (strain MRSN 2154) TaxID=1157951 RepID=A0A140NLA5_PROSM|nr:hypothetical protein S70_09155 [Providencia stuartii MRSN 2154]